MVFVIIIIIIITIYIADIISGICALLLAVYGAQHFRILSGLKVEVEKFGELNKEFKIETCQLRGEVFKLQGAQQQL